MIESSDIHPPERRLLCAVVSMALRDACETPVKEGKVCKLHSYARSAHEFLWTDALDGYLAYLDIEPDFYRNQLDKFMSNSTEVNVNGFSSEARRNFRLNRLLWDDQRRLHPGVPDDEDEDVEDVRPAPAKKVRRSPKVMP